MPAKVKAVAEVYGVYPVAHASNDLIRQDDDFKGRLRDDDWALCLGHGEYFVLRITGHHVTGKPDYRFYAKPLGSALKWKPTMREVGLLMAGQTIEAPINLEALRPTPNGTQAAWQAKSLEG